jgi:hypothetical protein
MHRMRRTMRVLTSVLWGEALVCVLALRSLPVLRGTMGGGTPFWVCE